MDIRIKHALAAALLASIPLSGHYLSAKLRLAQDHQDQTRASFEEATLADAQRLDDWFFASNAALKTMSQIPDLMTMAPERTRAEMRGVVASLPWVGVAFLARSDGKQLHRTDGLPGVEVGDLPYFKAALNRGSGRQVFISPATKLPVFAMGVPLGVETGADSGVAAFVLDVDRISQTMIAAPNPQSSKPGGLFGEQRFIALDDGKLVAHTHPEELAAKKDELADATKHPLWNQRPRQQQVSISSYADASGKRWMGAMRQSALGWYVAVEAAEDDLMAPLADSLSRLAWTCGGALLLALLGGFVAGTFARLGAPGLWPRSRFAGACSLGLACALPVGGALLIERSASESRESAQAAEILSQTTRRSARKVESWMRTNLWSLEHLAATPNLLERSTSQDPADLAWAKERLKLSISQLPWVRSSHVATDDGQQRLRSDSEKLPNQLDRKFFKQARVAAFGSQIVISRVNFQPSLLMDKALKAPDGKFLGVAGLAINADVASNQVARDKVGQTGFKFVLDKDGGLAAHPDKEQAKPHGDELPNYASHPLWRERPATDAIPTSVFSHDGRRFMGAIAKAGDFYVASVIPMEEIEAATRRQNGESAAWLALAIALSFGVGYLLAPKPDAPLRARDLQPPRSIH